MPVSCLGTPRRLKLPTHASGLVRVRRCPVVKSLILDESLPIRK